MREKPGGLVTGALFTIARKPKESMTHAVKDCSVLGMTVGLADVAEDFVLPIQHSTVRKKLFFVAGGINITPFLSMLKAIREKGEGRSVVDLDQGAKGPFESGRGGEITTLCWGEIGRPHLLFTRNPRLRHIQRRAEAALVPNLAKLLGQWS